MEQLWTWTKTDALYGSDDIYLGPNRCSDFEKDIWFELGKSMWKRHHRIYQGHVKYIHNDIVKTFRVIILQYADRVCEMHYLAKYSPPPLTKDRGFE